MIDHPGLLMSIGAFLLVILPVVFLHEMGHYLAGRWFGIGVETFSIGFGQTIAGWRDRAGTHWKIGWLPLGGYVRFAGDMSPAGRLDPDWLLLPAAQRNRTFQAKPVWQRAIVVAAGPAVNFLLAVVLLAGFALAFGELRTAPVVGGVLANSPAAAAGLHTGDRVTAIDGTGVDAFSDIGRAVLMRGGERVAIDFTRAGRSNHTSAVVAAQHERDRFGNTYAVGRLGIVSTAPTVVPVGVLEAPGIAVKQTGEMLRFTVEGIVRIVTGRVAVKELHGPVGTARIAGEQFALGWTQLVFLIVVVSINLGFINLLPIPMLDGGHLFFYAIEALRRRPVTPRVQEWAFRCGLAALLVLMLVTTFNDLGAFGWWKSLAERWPG